MILISGVVYGGLILLIMVKNSGFCWKPCPQHSYVKSPQCSIFNLIIKFSHDSSVDLGEKVVGVYFWMLMVFGGHVEFSSVGAADIVKLLSCVVG